MKMNVVAIAAAATFLTSAAFAGNFDVAVVEANVVAPAPMSVARITDFSGFYAGATLGSINDGRATFIYDGEPGDAYDLDGTGYGIFGGYNWQRGSFVFGAEVAALSFDGTYDFGGDQTVLNSVIDLKGRAGYVLGNALVYGFVGLSSGDWDQESINGLTNSNMTGPNYGLGLDYKITDSVMLGAEYTQRKMEADFNENDNGIEADFGMFQLRAAYTF